MTYSEELILDSAWNRFLENGVFIQFGARNMTQAINSYNNSCIKCTMNRRCTGKECAITKAFLLNTEKFNEELKRKPTLRQQVEFALE